MIKYGLKAARFEFTDIINEARDGGEVSIVEIGNDRKSKHGYIVRKMTEAELNAVPDKPKSTKVPLPLPTASPLL